MTKLLTATALALAMIGPALAQTSEPTEYRVIDAADLKVAPDRYTDKPIELRRMYCYYADEDDIRCAGDGGGLAIFASTVESAEEKDALAANCSEVKKFTSPACTKTIRLVPASNTQDRLSEYKLRTIIRTETIEIVSAPKPRNKIEAVPMRKPRDKRA
jgi:hypothetical protein